MPTDLVILLNGCFKDVQVMKLVISACKDRDVLDITTKLMNQMTIKKLKVECDQVSDEIM